MGRGRGIVAVAVAVAVAVVASLGSRRALGTHDASRTLPPHHPALEPQPEKEGSDDVVGAVLAPLLLHEEHDPRPELEFGKERPDELDGRRPLLCLRINDHEAKNATEADPNFASDAPPSPDHDGHELAADLPSEQESSYLLDGVEPLGDCGLDDPAALHD